MKLKSVTSRMLPKWSSAVFALISGIFLTLAFPDVEIAPLAFFALVPLFLALLKEKHSFVKSLVTGWIFGTVFFAGTGWWLTFAPITYASFPVLLAYSLLLGVCLVAGFFPALACGLISICVKRFGNAALLAAPFIWVAAEFLRFSLTGNNWNTIGYSQAFGYLVALSAVGGVSAVSFLVVLFNSAFAYILNFQFGGENRTETLQRRIVTTGLALSFPVVGLVFVSVGYPLINGANDSYRFRNWDDASSAIVAVQPNVPMSGIAGSKWIELRTRQTSLAQAEVEKLRKRDDFPAGLPVTVILPESPMNFKYEEDGVFRNFINDFAERNDVSVLFNSAEPDSRREYGYFNSAVLVNKNGEKAAQYDKIHLLPFGEFVPLPEFAQELIPPLVGRFSFGEEYDLLNIGDAKAGVMICFESHFPSLSREFVRNGADVLIEMTNDGYLGPTPVLRQHLASAAFRAAETDRPVFRVTNVGVTAYIDRDGRIFDTADSYVEATRVWSVRKSDNSRTIYVQFGEWFSWLCVIVSIGLLVFIFIDGRRRAAVGVELREGFHRGAIE